MDETTKVREHTAVEPLSFSDRQNIVELTSRQRNVVVISRVVANDLKRNGTTAEAHTAALLDIVGDAVAHGYEAELVQVARTWRREREARGQ